MIIKQNTSGFYKSSVHWLGEIFLLLFSIIYIIVLISSYRFGALSIFAFVMILTHIGALVFSIKRKEYQFLSSFTGVNSFIWLLDDLIYVNYIYQFGIQAWLQVGIIFSLFILFLLMYFPAKFIHRQLSKKKEGKKSIGGVAMFICALGAVFGQLSAKYIFKDVSFDVREPKDLVWFIAVICLVSSFLQVWSWTLYIGGKEKQRRKSEV